MLSDVALIFFLSRVLFYATVLLVPLVLHPYAGTQYQPWYTGAPRLIDASWRWDAGWYRSIIVSGYAWNGVNSNVAFFPLYPLLVRATLVVAPAGWIWYAGVLLNQVAFFGALIAVWLYAEHRAGRDVARRTLYLLCIFPTALFFSAAYTEALFLLATAAAFAFWQRDRFGSAGVAGFLASLDRGFGVFLAPAGLIYLWQHRRLPLRALVPRAAALLLVPAGLGSFMLYLWARFGDPLLFLKAQSFWSHSRVFPLLSLYRALDFYLRHPAHSVFYLMDLLNAVAMLLALVFALVIIRRDPAGAIYVLLTVLSVLSAPVDAFGLQSGARYAAVFFPLFVPLAVWSRRRWLLVLLTLAFLPLNILLTGLWAQWYWVV